MTSEEFNINPAPTTPESSTAGPAFADMPPVSSGRNSSLGRTRAMLRNNLLLVVLFAGGLVAVYLMSLRGGPIQASAEQVAAEKQVDLALAKFAVNSPTATAKSVISSCYQEARQRQIPLEKLKGNPFIFKAVMPGISTQSSDKSVDIHPAHDLDARAAIGAIKTMNLQSVLTGPNGKSLATISNNLLSEGQVISGWTVTRIEPKQVILTWKDQTYVLKMAE